MTKIGLEIHCQLTNLESKLFCSCKANYRGFEINENICPNMYGIARKFTKIKSRSSKKSNNDCNGI